MKVPILTNRSKAITKYLTLILMIAPFFLGISDEPDELFTFYTQNEKDVVIKGVYPTSSNDIIILHSIPNPNNYTETISLSPDGQWLILQHRGEERYLKEFTLLSMNTGEATPIISAYSFFDPGLRRDLTIIWSPDSRYVAFNAIAPLDEVRERAEIAEIMRKMKVYIYDLETRATLPLLTFGEVVELTWSPSGTSLAVSVFQPVSEESCCDELIEIFHLPDNVPHLVRVTSHLTCHLAWSPDEGRLSFNMACSILGALYSSTFLDMHDVYLLNISSLEVIPLTHFTQHPQEVALEGSKGLFVSKYSLIWYDAQTLLVGVRAFQSVPYDLDSVTIQTLAYDISTGERKRLASYQATDWAIDPTMESIAFRAECFRMSLPDEKGHPSFIFEDAQIYMASFDGQSLDISVSAPPGCNPQWSSDGAYLAYENHGSPWLSSLQCDEHLESFIFIESETAQITHYRPEENQTVIPLGWVVITE